MLGNTRRENDIKRRIISGRTSTRFCIVCGAFTTWTLDTVTGHSKCQSCGADSRYSRGLRPAGRPESMFRAAMRHRK